MQDDDTICCGQNKMLGLFTRPSFLNHSKNGYILHCGSNLWDESIEKEGWGKTWCQKLEL